MAKSKELAINCTGIEMLPIQDLKPFQGGFKELRPADRAKLKKEIKELGLVEPISVWKEGKKNWIMNGHQRVDLLREMVKAEEITLSLGLPVQYVQAGNSEEASKIVLALASTYGRINRKGLGKFMKKAGFSDEFVQERFRFPDLDLDNFERESGDKKVEFTASKKPKLVKCPKCGEVFDQKTNKYSTKKERIDGADEALEAADLESHGEDD